MRTIDRFDLALWPSASADFVFRGPQGGAARGLVLTVEFDPSAYGAESQERAQADAETYAAIGRDFRALEGGVAMQTSMDAKEAHLLDPAAFATFAESVAAYLRELVIGATPVTPDALTLPVAIEPVNKDDLFALDVAITVSSGQQQTMSQIRPRAGLEFARALEHAYADKESFLKVMVERPEPSSENPWIVRLRRQGAPAGPGIAFACNGSARYYAPVPLANVPLSRSSVPTVAFDPDNGIAWEDPVYRTFSNVDMDAWARMALSAIDRVVSSDFGGAHGEHLRKLQEIKTGLASRVASTAAPILSTGDAPPTAASLENAIKAMRQQMLLKAESAYDVLALCQFEAAVSSQYVDDPANQVYAPRLAGTLRSSAPNPATDNQVKCTFSSVRTVLAPGKGFVSSALTLSGAALPASVSLNLDFDIEKILYTGARSELTFAVPFDAAAGMALQTTIGQVDIPILLRAIPHAPFLLSQEATPTDKAAAALDGAMRWTYAMSYDAGVVEHDTIGMSLSLNVSEPRADTRLSDARSLNELDLFDHLARLAGVWPMMQSALTQAQPSRIDALLADFVRLVEPLPAAWAAWRPVSPEATDATHVDISLRERCKGGFLALTRAVSVASALSDPVIQLIDGETTYTAQAAPEADEVFYVDEHGNKLTYEAARHLTRRRLIFNGLDVTLLENATGAVRVFRNRDLIRDKNEQPIQTSPEFVYSTLPLSFAAGVAPMLASDERFDVSVLSSPPRQPLAVHLQRMLSTLHAGAPPDKIQPVRLDAAYAKRASDGVPDIVWPIFVGSEMALDGARADELARESAAVLANWFAVNRPANGCFRFRLTLFSTLSESRFPLLELTRLELSVGDVTDLRGFTE